MESSSMYILAVKPHAARRKSQATCPPAHLQGLRVLAVSGAQGVTASITMHAPDTKQQSHNHPINVSNCVAMLLKIFNNVLEHPEEQKFRQVWLLRPSTLLPLHFLCDGTVQDCNRVFTAQLVPKRLLSSG
eukprot:scaffold323606_cov18-Tisochrysis_lutea.AAC.1